MATIDNVRRVALGEDPPIPFIAVGVDGTPGSLEALRWAAREAMIHSVALVAVRIWHFPVNASGFLTDESVAAIQREEEEELELDLFEVIGDAPGIEIVRLVTSGATTKTLFASAEKAEMLVIGSNGHRGLTNAVIGSVSSQVAHYASCPVVVVPLQLHLASSAARSASDGAGQSGG